MLERREGRYANTPETDQFLDRAKPWYISGLLEMANARLYRFWGSLAEALRTGEPQNEARGGTNPFDTLYADTDRLKQFLAAMTGIGLSAARAIAEKFQEWEQYQRFIDVGCAQGGAAGPGGAGPSAPDGRRIRPAGGETGL